MKKTLDIKKLILLNMPYILLGLFATNFGEAWRMAQGADASEKFLSLVAVLPGALQSFWPSLHPLDLLVGLCCGGCLRLAVYLKSKNAKKYRLDCQHFFRQIFLGYFSDIVQAFDTLRKNVCGDDYTSLHNPIVLSSVLPAYGMFHSIQILFL